MKLTNEIFTVKKTGEVTLARVPVINHSKFFGNRQFVIFAVELDRQVLAALKLSPKPTERIKEAFTIQKKCLDSTWFVAADWTTPLADVKTHIEAADTANKAGDVSARKTAIKKMNQDLNHIKADVQVVADNKKPNAETIILSAGLHVKIVTTPTRTGFSVIDGDEVGQLIFALFLKGLLKEGQKSGMINSIRYEQSQNQNNWVEVPGSDDAGATMTKGGYQSGTTWFFRARLNLTKKQKSDWIYSGPIKVK